MKIGKDRGAGGAAQFSSNRRYIKEIDEDEKSNSASYDQNIIYMFYKSKGMQRKADDAYKKKHSTSPAAQTATSGPIIHIATTTAKKSRTNATQT